VIRIGKRLLLAGFGLSGFRFGIIVFLLQLFEHFGAYQGIYHTVTEPPSLPLTNISGTSLILLLAKASATRTMAYCSVPMASVFCLVTSASAKPMAFDSTGTFGNTIYFGSIGVGGGVHCFSFGIGFSVNRDPYFGISFGVNGFGLGLTM
jgi:hypothetical protein